MDAVLDMLSVVDDEDEDMLTGAAGLDLFYRGLGVTLTDPLNKERIQS